MSNPDPHKPEPVSPPRSMSGFPNQPELPETFSQRQLAIFIVIGFIVLVGLGYSLFARASVQLITPRNNSALAADELEFRWQYSGKEASYVVEVYDEVNNELVLRQIWEKENYRPSRDQKEALEAGRRYRWVVISNPDIKQASTFKSDPGYFTITRAAEKVVAPTPSPEPTPVPPDQQQQPILPNKPVNPGEQLDF
jgi:hypothetical protein